MNRPVTHYALERLLHLYYIHALNVTQSRHAALSHFNFICVKNAVQEWPLCAS